jgi:SAM-dependent methyltransferase
MYSGKLVKYYDDLYHIKDYHIESIFIENNSKLNKVLDVGCGTGTHLKNLFKDGRIFYGIDISKEMIELANNKFRNYSSCYFKNCSIDKFTETNNFDTIISMFNIVNHILDRKDLELYFKSISGLLSIDGVFIFDCFDAALVDDEPRYTEKEVISSAVGGRYLIDGTTSFDYDTGYMTIDNHVSVLHLDEEVDSFDYTLGHRIWLSDFLEEMIEKYNMKVEKVVSNKGNKITFVCEGSNRQ